MHDLADVCQLLNLCNERISKIPEYEEAVYDIVYLCRYK